MVTVKMTEKAILPIMERSLFYLPEYETKLQSLLSIIGEILFNIIGYLELDFIIIRLHHF